MVKELLKSLMFALGLAVFLLFGVIAMNTLGISWGKMEFLPASTITVSGEAKKQEMNQIATYYVGVSVNDDDKQKATDSVNMKMTDIVKKVKEFGIEDKDIQTQNVSVSENQQVELLTYPTTDLQTQQKKWSANNSITVILRDISKAQSFTDMLHATGATNVSGPSYSLDTYNDVSEDLLSDAIADARTKAEKIAKASGRKLGKVITVSESGSPVYYPMALEAKGRGGDTSVPTPVEPGSQTVYKSVTVVFELK